MAVLRSLLTWLVCFANDLKSSAFWFSALTRHFFCKRFTIVNLLVLSHNSAFVYAWKGTPGLASAERAQFRAPSLDKSE